MSVTLKLLSPTHGTFFGDIVIVTTDADPTCMLSYDQKSQLAEKSVDSLTFIESMQGIIFTQTEMNATNNHEVSVKEGIEKEILHNKNNMIEKPKSETMLSKPSQSSETMLSKPSQSIRRPLFEQNASNDQRIETQNIKVKKLRYNAANDVSNTESPKALAFPSESTSTLAGQTILLSGMFPHHDSGQPLVKEEDIGKDTIIEVIKTHGGEYAKKITKKVNLLVIGDRPGREKYKRAAAKGILIITINDLLQLTTGATTIDALRQKKNVFVEAWSERPKKGTKRKTGSKEANVEKQKTKEARNGSSDVERKLCSGDGCTQFAEKGGRCNNCFLSLWKRYESNVTRR